MTNKIIQLPKSLELNEILKKSTKGSAGYDIIYKGNTVCI